MLRTACAGDTVSRTMRPASRRQAAMTMHRTPTYTHRDNSRTRSHPAMATRRRGGSHLMNSGLLVVVVKALGGSCMAATERNDGRGDNQASACTLPLLVCRCRAVTNTWGKSHVGHGPSTTSARERRRPKYGNRFLAHFGCRHHSAHAHVYEHRWTTRDPMTAQFCSKHGAITCIEHRVHPPPRRRDDGRARNPQTCCVQARIT